MRNYPAYQQRVLLSANTTDTTASIAATATKPTPTIAENHVPTNNAGILALSLFGAGADDATLSAVIVGWKFSYLSSSGLWVPYELARLAGALSTFVGLSGYDIADTDRVADTLTKSVTQNVSIQTAGGNNLPAVAYIPVDGYEVVSIYPLKGTSTNANALYSLE